MWVAYFEARLALFYQQDDLGEGIFQQLVEGATNNILQAVALWSVGDIRVVQHRWTEAIRLYRQSLAILEKEGSLMYAAHVMRAVGHAYSDLAENSGGLVEEEQKFPNKIASWWHILQHLPYLIYEKLVHRISFLPNWYFGTNYQNWIIYYLLREAVRWYSKAEKQFRIIQNQEGVIESQRFLAMLEHQSGRWSRARLQYSKLLATDVIQSSLYRRATVKLGIGRALLAEKKLLQAQSNLSEAIEIFRRVRDLHSIGITTSLLGRIYTDSGQFEYAAAAYIESVQAFARSHQDVSCTQSIAELENLIQQSSLPEEVRHKAIESIHRIPERHYLTRFPEKLLRRFRRLAILGAFPLTYLFTFIISGFYLFLLQVVEVEMITWLQIIVLQFAVINTFSLIALVILLSLPVLWCYRLIYMAIGLLIVQVVGRRIVGIEKEQPHEIVTTSSGLIYRYEADEHETNFVNWSDIAAVTSVNYRQWKIPLNLFSHIFLKTKSKTLVVLNALTTNYPYLQQQIEHALKNTSTAIRSYFNFIIFEPRSTLIALAVALGSALLAAKNWEMGQRIEMDDGTISQAISTPVTTVLFLFFLNIFFGFPAVILWRLLLHQLQLYKQMGYASIAIPLWIIWVLTILATIVAGIWIIFYL